MTRRPFGEKIFEIALISDTHVNEAEDFSASPYPANAEANPRARHIFNQVAASAAAFVVHLGDMVNPVPELPSYSQAADNFKAIASTLSVPVHLVPGNHDIGDKPVDWMPAGMVNAENIAIYEKHFGQHFYSFDYDNVHFVVLNASLINSGDPSEATQRNWLESDLEENIGRRTFFFIHYPIYVSSPTEAPSYDNIDEPGRGWLLGLIKTYKPEALFCAHVHNFWYDVYGDTEMYVMPSTCFVRHDYSEMYRIDGGDQFGRNDSAKLGYVTLSVFETGHVASYHRTYGQGQAAGASPVSVAYPRTHIKTTNVDRVAVDMRHAWAEELTVAPSGAVDEFRRKTARNDYPLMALWEMGICGMRVPIQDLMDARVRRRMALMCDVGHKFQVYQYDIPDAATCAAIAKHADLIDQLEIVISWDRRADLLPAIAALKVESGVPILLSRVNRKDAAKTSGGRYNHLISHGFSIGEIDELTEFAKAEGAALDGFLFSIPREEAPSSTISLLDKFASKTGKRPVLYVKSTSGSPWASYQDDTANAIRIAETVMAATASKETYVVLDTFADADRGYFVRTGLVDRRFNPRLAGRMLTALMGRLSDRDWTPGEKDGVIVDGSGTRLTVGMRADLQKLILAKTEKIEIWFDIAMGTTGSLSSFETEASDGLIVMEYTE